MAVARCRPDISNAAISTATRPPNTASFFTEIGSTALSVALNAKPSPVCVKPPTPVATASTPRLATEDVRTGVNNPTESVFIAARTTAMAAADDVPSQGQRFHFCKACMQCDGGMNGRVPESRDHVALCGHRKAVHVDVILPVMRTPRKRGDH